jgi:hypothetical protein
MRDKPRRGAPAPMERMIETLLLGTRWGLLLCAALFIAVIAIHIMVGRERVHLVAGILTLPDVEIVLINPDPEGFCSLRRGEF